MLRDGRAVGHGSSGRHRDEVDHHADGRPRPGRSFFRACRTQPGEPILVLEELRVWKTASPASLVLRRGEILGIAGLVGAGRTTLLRALFGLAPVVSGLIRIHHFEGGYASPRARIAQGVGFLSEDRKTEGLALSRSIEDNVTYSSLKRHARHGWLRLKERRAEVARWLERLHVSATGPAQSVAGPFGRQPAEGGAGAAAAPAGRRFASRRADARNRRRVQGRDLPRDRRAGRRRARRSWSSALIFPSCSGSATALP